MRRRGFEFDDVSNLVKLKEKNRDKTKKMLLVMANLKDRATLSKVSSLLKGLPDEQLRIFNNYIRFNQYLKKNAMKANPEAIKIASAVKKILYGSQPQDPFLADLVNRFNANADVILRCKNYMEKKDVEEEELQKARYFADKLSEANAQIFYDLDQYDS